MNHIRVPARCARRMLSNNYGQVHTLSLFSLYLSFRKLFIDTQNLKTLFHS
ncbi:unnamed protein product [Brassica oleracea]